MPGKQQGRRSTAETGLERVTIHDVARLAGVSRQTVSRAVNDKGEIDSDTKERVLDAVRTLGYRPSRFARGLRRSATVTLGLVISDLTNPYFPEVASGVLEVAEERGWHVVVTESRNDPQRERNALDVLSHQVDAIVGYCHSTDDVLGRQTGGLPMVLLERGPDQTRFGSVGIDVAAGLEQGVGHLVAAGHRRIGMLDGAPPDAPSARRTHFVVQARAHGVPIGPDWVVSCPEHTVEWGERGMDQLLDAHPELTAVFGFNDLIAIGAMHTLRRRGRRVPDDVAVLGFDGLALGALVEPPLTTLRIDTRQLGRLAVAQVARMLAGEPPSRGEDAWIRPELLVRASA